MLVCVFCLWSGEHPTHRDPRRANLTKTAQTEDSNEQDIQNIDHGCVLRLIARDQTRARRTHRKNDLPRGRSRGVQQGRRHRAHADQGALRAGRDRFTQIARQALRRGPRDGQAHRLRSHSTCHARAAIPFTRRARIARGRCEIKGPLHVDHEHAAIAVCGAHPRSRRQRLPRRLHRPHRLGQL